MWSAYGEVVCDMHAETRHSLCMPAELLDSLLMRNTGTFGSMLIVA